MATTLTFDNLMQSAMECSRGVKWKDSIATWVHPRNLASNCLKLWRSLDRGTYRLGGYVTFDVTEPKRRTIKSPRFRDRVVQRAMCNAGLYDDLTRDNIHDNCACQNGKGTKFAIERLACHMRRYFRKYWRDGWVLRLDIHKFFDSIPHRQIKEMVDRKVTNKEFKKMVCDIIDSFPDPGIGLGSQISQLLAISYLSDIDHYVTERLNVFSYIRYSDDIVIIDNDKAHLECVWRTVAELLAEKGLQLNPKSCMHRLSQGIKFLKFRFVLTESGRVIRLLGRKSIVRMCRRIRKLVVKRDAGLISREDVLNSFNSWRAHALHGNSNSAIRRVEKCLTK